MKGILYAVGVGPGDPDLLTVKAIKTISMADVIACPAKGSEPGAAYQIARQAYPSIYEKERMLLSFPMKTENLVTAHQEAADQILDRLKSGKNVAFLTLGDPEFYSTFYYIADKIKEQGYDVEIINGITSFSAVGAKLQLPIALGSEPVMITTGEYTQFAGTVIILKAGGHLKEIKNEVLESGKTAYMVENCGMPDEKVYYSIQDMPDEAGYFTIVVVK
ncbi:MAG: precorrin-2 C(20)-methyltransferase [Eubacterium sp.]|nr:precorrin-2 C(20)-methyltransferase [Eubacterium sp.]